MCFDIFLVNCLALIYLCVCACLCAQVQIILIVNKTFVVPSENLKFHQSLFILVSYHISSLHSL